MEKTKKLQPYFKDFLPLNFREFKLAIPQMTNNQATVANLLRICAEDDDIKAIKIAFERIIGKPEKVTVIKRTRVRMVYPDAETKLLEKPISVEKPVVIDPLQDKVVLDEKDAPGFILRRALDDLGDLNNEFAYEVVDKKNEYSLVEVIVANLFSIATRGSNIGAIDLLFNYLDGSVADVIRVEGVETLVLENYADVAPYEAVQDEEGVWYVETEAKV